MPGTPEFSHTVFLALAGIYWLLASVIFAAKPLDNWGTFYHFSKILLWVHPVLDLSLLRNSIISFFTKVKPFCKYLVVEISVRVQVWSGRSQYYYLYLLVLLQEQEKLLSNFWGEVKAPWHSAMCYDYQKLVFSSLVIGTLVERLNFISLLPFTGVQ